MAPIENAFGSDALEDILSNMDKISLTNRHGASIIGISGLTGGSGKSSTALNLASSLALCSKKVALIDFSFGSLSICDSLDLEKPVVTLNDFFSGEISSISKALTPSPYKNLYFIESGMEYLDFGKKSASPIEKLSKALKNINVDYIFIDLGLITDRTKIELFLMADAQLLVLEPSENVQNLVQNLASAMVLELVEGEFSRSKNLKSLQAKFSEDFVYNGDSLVNKLKACVEGDKRNLEKVEKLATKTNLCIAVNKAVSKDDIALGAMIRDGISERIGIGASYVGFIPKDDIIFDAAGIKRPAPYYNVYTPLSEAFRNVARNITGIESINVDKDALISIHRRLEGLESREGTEEKKEAIWSIEALKDQMIRDLEDEIRKRRVKTEVELVQFKEARLAEISDKIARELAPMREEAKAEAVEARRVNLERVNQEISELENERRKSINEWAREMKRDEFKQFKSRLADLREKKLDDVTQKWELTKRTKLEKFNLEIDSRRSVLLKDIENYKNSQILAIDEEMEKMAEHTRKEVRAATAKEVEPVRKLVWSELEEDRLKKIATIKEDVGRLRGVEIDIVETEMVEMKAHLKENLETEINTERKTLLEDIHGEVMRLSSVCDSKNAHRLSQMQREFELKYQAEYEKFSLRLQSDLARLRESKTKEVTKMIEADRATRIAANEKEIQTQSKEMMEKALRALRKQITIEKEKVQKAVSLYRDKSMDSVALEREQLLAQSEQDILESKNQKLDFVREEATRLYDRLSQKALLELAEEKKEGIAALQRTMDNYRNEKKEALQNALMEARRIKVEEVTSYITNKRKDMLDNLTKEISHIKRSMLVRVKAEVSESRSMLMEGVESEAASALQTRQNEIAEELSAEHQKRLKAITASVRTEEMAMRERLHEIMYDEEKTMRNRMLREVDSERKEVLAEIMAGVKPQQIRLDRELKKEIDMKRKEGFQELRREVEQMRSQHIDKLKEWENAEKSHMTAEMESRLARKESSKLKLIEDELDSWRKSAMERENVTLDNYKTAALKKVRDVLEDQKQKHISVVKKDIEMARKKLSAETKAQIEKEREILLAKAEKKIEETQNLKILELDQAISSKRAELFKECEAEIERVRSKRMEAIRKDLETEDARMQKMAHDKRKKLWRQNEEWVRMDIDQMRLELKNKMAEEFEALRLNKRIEMEKQIASETDAMMSRISREAGYDKIRLERLVRAEVEENRDVIKAEAAKMIEDEIAVKYEQMDKSVDRHRGRMKQEIGEWIDTEKKRGLEALKQKLDSEEKKRFKMMEVEIKTEELKRRQDLMDKMMKKREELEETFKAEKQRYLEKLRDETSKSHFSDRTSLNKEIEKISKNWRMMN